MASLLSLPPEIFEAVLEDVDGDDVLNLRCVNRRISALSTHQFGLKCLADLSFLCTQDSLKGLLELVAHPLGRYIRRLTFSTSIDWGFEGQVVDEIERKNPKLIWYTPNSEKHFALLIQVLEKLDDIGLRPTLGIYDPLVPWITLDEANSGRGRRGFKFDEFYGDVELNSTMRTRARESVKFVLDAVHKAKYPLEAFYVHLNDRPTNYQNPAHAAADNLIFHPLILDYITPTSEESFLDIEVVYNSFNPQANLNLQMHIDTKFQKYEILTLPIEGRDWLRHPRIPFVERESLIPSCTAMRHHFREIRLALCDVSVQSLTMLLGSQSETLRKLHLEYVTINLFDEEEDAENDAANPDDSGLNILLFLKDGLELGYLRMNRVSSTRDQSRLIGGHDDTWTSTEEVQDGLQMYIQREENDEHSVDEEFSDDDEGEWISVHHSEDEDEESEEENKEPEVPEVLEGPRGSERL